MACGGVAAGSRWLLSGGLLAAVVVVVVVVVRPGRRSVSGRLLLLTACVNPHLWGIYYCL